MIALLLALIGLPMGWIVARYWDLRRIRPTKLTEEQEPEISDPLEEEFRALEDAVLKRDDPTAWMAKRGFPGLQLGASPYANDFARQAIALQQQQFQQQRWIQAQQQQGYLSGLIGGVGGAGLSALSGIFGPQKPPRS